MTPMTDLMWRILEAAAQSPDGAKLSGQCGRKAGWVLQYRGFGLLHPTEPQFTILPAGTYVLSRRLAD